MTINVDQFILERLAETGSAETCALATACSRDHQEIIGAVKRLQSIGDIIRAELVQSERWVLTSEGEEMAANGSYEAILFNKIESEGLPKVELEGIFGKNGNIAFSKAMQAKWVELDKTAPGGPVIRKKAGVTSIIDEVQLALKELQLNSNVDEKKLSDLKKRKLVEREVVKSYKLSKGENFTLTVEKPEADLTSEMLASGEWKTKTFKSYNLDSLGILPVGGHLHPLMKVRTEFRNIFLEMGFSEMPTNNYVESSFWNFDALFQPQQHPARDAHDTFFISDPKNSSLDDVDNKYLAKVKHVHESGDFGSQGYGYTWKIEESRKNIMRTHTTAVSSKMLYQLAQQKPFKPVRYFSIDRVFRNETLDATHLAEFHQVEGVVADYNLSLGHLIGVLKEFFRRLGMEKLRFKPAYNPYTEPSMEVFGYHEGLKKWMELGNSGIFRPEMLLPMGLPKNVSVIAWGLSLERPTMIKYAISNIRDLMGHKVDLDMVYTNPICRLDKD